MFLVFHTRHDADAPHTTPGEVRSTSYVLPTTGHVYGKACQRDGEGAGEVSTPNKSLVPFPFVRSPIRQHLDRLVTTPQCDATTEQHRPVACSPNAPSEILRVGAHDVGCGNAFAAEGVSAEFREDKQEGAPRRVHHSGGTARVRSGAPEHSLQASFRQEGGERFSPIQGSFRHRNFGEGRVHSPSHRGECCSLDAACITPF